MDFEKSASETPKPLPQVPGPKLKPFTPTAHADIEFIKELGNPAVDMDAFVWKVRINGKTPYYALKMFRFNNPKYLRRTVGGDLNCLLASPQLYLDFFDPFNCECRAYGRLADEGRQDLAIQAHGYLLLTPEQESEVAKRCSGMGSDDESDGNDFWRWMDEHYKLPVHAIVKTLADDHLPFTPEQLGDVWRDLEDLHKLGILVRDIKIGNYLGGKLVDFSRSWTMPHPSLEHIHPVELRDQRQRDPDGLEMSIIDWGIGNRWNWDEVVIPEELQACAAGKSQNGRYGNDPRLYDWRKWEEDLDAVDTFLEHELYAQPEPEAGEDGEE
ncbi:hypothetical protein VTI28DRAFT_4475 [Corynascus sepedonium]